MAGSDYEIALATRDDIAGILDLQEQNLRERGGTLSVRFTREWFEAALGDMPVIVARKVGRVVGYLVSSSPAAQGHRADHRGHAAGLSWRAGCLPLRADLRCRERARAGPAGRADVGARRAAARPRKASPSSGATIRRSMRAHAKIGMRQVAEFIHDDAAIVVVVYPG